MIDRKSRALPSGWRWTKLADVCEQDRRIIEPSSEEAKRLPYLSLEHIESNTGRILRNPNNLVENEGKSTSFAFDSRHVLYGKLRPYLNKVALPDFSGRCTTELIPILPKGIDRQFLALTLRRGEVVSAAMSEKTGSRMPRADMDKLFRVSVPLPPLLEQQRIAAKLNEQFTAVERAHNSVMEQFNLLDALVFVNLRQSLSSTTTEHVCLENCFTEIKRGVGENWKKYPVVGATRTGLAPAKEQVGKNPEKYKLVEPGTIFYNPMRILLGSIAMIDVGEDAGITSPDYVVLKARDGILHPRWFYYWFRSTYGERFIKSLARGAVRERILFNRLVTGHIEIPSWEVQCRVAKKLQVIKQIKGLVQAQAAAIYALPSVILRQAFRGEL